MSEKLNLCLTQDGTKNRATIIIDPNSDFLDVALLQKEINKFFGEVSKVFLPINDNNKTEAKP